MISIRGVEQLLRRNVKRFRGGLVFEAHRLLYHSTLGLRVIKKKQKIRGVLTSTTCGFGGSKRPPDKASVASCAPHTADYEGTPPIEFSHNGVAGARASDGQ